MFFRLVTFNTWVLPWPASRHLRARLRFIEATLPGLRADALVLQEVWTRATREHLLRAARAAGLCHTWYPPRAVGGGGLLVMSRHPISRVHFERFHLRGLPQRLLHGDYHSGKGFAVIDLDTPAGRIHLAATHLHAAYQPQRYPEYQLFQAAQAAQLASYLAASGTSRSGPLLVAGDFNFDDDSDGYLLLRDLGRLHDVAVSLDERWPTLPADNPYNRRRGTPDARIDYVFLRGAADIECTWRPRALQRVFDQEFRVGGAPAACSDHVGVLAELELVRSSAPRSGVSPAIDDRVLARARDCLHRGRALARARRRRERQGTLLACLAGGLGLLSRVSRVRPLAGLTLLLGLVFDWLCHRGQVHEATAFDVVEAQLDAVRSAEVKAGDAAAADSPSPVR